MKPTITFSLDTRYKPKKSNRVPVALLLTLKGSPKRFPTIYKLTPEEFDKTQGSGRVSKELDTLRSTFQTIFAEATIAAESQTKFTLADFTNSFIRDNKHFRSVKYVETPDQELEFDYRTYEEKFPIIKMKPKSGDEILALYIYKIKSLLRRKRIGTAIHYQDSYTAIFKFCGHRKISEVDRDWLYEFEEYLTTVRKCNLTTVGIKMRPLRHVFKIAIKKKIVKQDAYPFEKESYDVPTGRNLKKALNADQLLQLWNFVPRCDEEFIAKCYWFFLFFGNGMNAKDCALMKQKNRHDDIFYFNRAKTIDTTRHAPKNIIVFLNDDMKRFIEILGNKNKEPESYVFPILNSELDEVQQHFQTKRFVKFIGDWMSKIAGELKFPLRIGVMTARHSFATYLKNLGVSTKLIGEMLGHTSEATTERYLASFESQVYKDCGELLMSWKKVSPVMPEGQARSKSGSVPLQPVSPIAECVLPVLSMNQPNAMHSNHPEVINSGTFIETENAEIISPNNEVSNNQMNEEIAQSENSFKKLRKINEMSLQTFEA